MKTGNFPEKQNVRRKSALDRLEVQLEKGVKNTKDGDQPLTDKDVKRIEKEIQALKSKTENSSRYKRSKKSKWA